MMSSKLSRIGFHLIMACFAVVVVSITARKLSAEPEVVCAWCGEACDLLGNCDHGFPNPTDRCAGTPSGGGVTWSCARCGGTSACHGFNDPPQSNGHCHIACGGDNLAKADSAIALALVQRDFHSLANLVRHRPHGVEVSFSAEGGRIEVVTDCAPGQVASTFVIPSAIRAEIAAAAASEE
jgi:hypothetical protein